MKTKLTTASVKALRCKHPGGTMYADATLPGFAAVVYPSGAVHFRARFTLRDGRRRKVDVGRFGVLTVDQAREKAREILAHAELGGDPAADREKARGTPTFEAWRKTYLGRLEGRRIRLKDTARYLALAAESWRGRKLSTITRSDVENLYQKVGEEHPTSANRLLAALSACFTMAVREDLIPTSPAASITRFKENPPRARVLTPEEMSRLVTALQEEDEHTRAAFALLVGSGLRLTEALRARWADFDAEAGTLRLPRQKSGHPEVIPVPQTMVEVLARLSRPSEFIVAGRPVSKPGAPAKPRYDLKRPWSRLREKAALPDVRIHDLRRSFGLAVSRQSGLHVASRLLRHRDVRITQAVYSPLDLESLRDAVEKRQDALPFAPEKKRSKRGPR